MIAIFIGILFLLVWYYADKAKTEKEIRFIREFKSKQENDSLNFKLKKINHEKNILEFIGKIREHQLQLADKKSVEDNKIRFEDFYYEYDIYECKNVRKVCLYTRIRIGNKKLYRHIKIIEKLADFTEMEFTYTIADLKNYIEVESLLKIDDTSKKNKDELWNLYINILGETNQKLIKEYEKKDINVNQ